VKNLLTERDDKAWYTNGFRVGRGEALAVVLPQTELRGGHFISLFWLTRGLIGQLATFHCQSLIAIEIIKNAATAAIFVISMAIND
jgi:hypothetical protein